MREGNEKKDWMREQGGENYVAERSGKSFERVLEERDRCTKTTNEMKRERGSNRKEIGCNAHGEEKESREWLRGRKRRSKRVGLETDLHGAPRTGSVSDTQSAQLNRSPWLAANCPRCTSV